MNPTQEYNETFITNEANKEDASPFYIYDLDVAWEQIRTLIVQPEIRWTIKGYKGKPGNIFFEWVNDRHLIDASPKQLLIQIRYDYLLARIPVCAEKFRYLRLAPDADLNDLLEDFFGDTVDFAQWSYDAKDTKDKPLSEYRKRRRD